ncbi:MAG TPA: hypothetical protein PKC41_08790 [Chitinophagaceae bacterium]|nr:hypothetical protein [Chitinophagaceae bacterium]
MLSTSEIKEVKKVSVDLLTKLKDEKLKVDKWRESRQITASVKNMINDTLAYLPLQAYSDDDLTIKSVNVYQHIYMNYPGGGQNLYANSII